MSNFNKTLGKGFVTHLQLFQRTKYMEYTCIYTRQYSFLSKQFAPGIYPSSNITVIVLIPVVPLFYNPLF